MFGHPVSSAAALKNIEIIENEGLLEHVREIAPYFQQRLRELRKLPLVGDTRGLGLVGCVEGRIVDPENPDALEMDIARGSRIDKHCQALGLIVRPLWNMCVFSPPLIITPEQIDELFNILEKAFCWPRRNCAKQVCGKDDSRGSHLWGLFCSSLLLSQKIRLCCQGLKIKALKP